MKPLASLASFAGCAVALSALLATPALAEPTAEPIAVVVGSPILEDMDFALRPGGVEPGTKVHLLVSGLDQTIVDVDGDASKLTQAVDSTGKDLLEEPEQDGFGFGPDSPIGPFPSVSDDGKQLVVELAMPQTPAKGAASITLEGVLKVRVATGKTKAQAPNVSTAGGTFKLNGQPVEVTGLKESDWQPGKQELGLKMSSMLLESIASWTVTGPDGAELSDGPNSTMTMMDTAEVAFMLDEKVAAVTIAVELYDGMKTVDVPLKLEVGLGVE
ncbi:MAG: hypothetical protein AAF612_03275 [Planctomycetota bacterium]